MTYNGHYSNRMPKDDSFFDWSFKFFTIWRKIKINTSPQETPSPEIFLGLWGLAFVLGSLVANSKLYLSEF